MKKLTLEMPAQTTVEHWRELTNDNAHTEARLEICNWLLGQLHGQRFGKENVDGAYNAFHSVFYIHKALDAIKTLHEIVGHLPKDLMDIRHEKTNELIALVRTINPEVAEAIRKTL